MNDKLDRKVEALILEYGTKAVLASLCRECEKLGHIALSKKLHKVYKWLKGQ